MKLYQRYIWVYVKLFTRKISFYKMIDIHIHGLGDKDTLSKSVEDILTIAYNLHQRGIKGFIPTIYPAYINDMRQQMALIKEAMSKQSHQQAKIFGIHIEGPFLNPQRAGALNSSSFLEPTEYNLNKLLDEFADIVKIITIAPELNGALRLIKMIRDLGIVVSLGHSDATFDEAQKAYKAGAKGITHLFNAMRGIHHREPGLAGFGLINEDIYVEVIADNFHLHEDVLKMIFKMKNKERIILISDSVKGEGSENNGIMNNQGNLMGGSFTIDISLKRLNKIGIPLDDALLTVYENPKRYLS